MRARAILKFLGYVLLFNALFLFISAFISLFLHENSLTPLMYSAVVCMLLGIFPLIFVEKIEEINLHEGIVISVFGWLITCLFGAIPYFMWGGEFTFANALFESVSGFTTTGGTVLTDVEALTKGLLFWRASTHLIGGVGIILFVLLVLPGDKTSRSTMSHTELSGLSMLNFQVRTRHILRIIVFVYFTLILVEIILLWLLGMSFFDAICHSFATVATGGFSTKNLSIAHYSNIWIEIVIMIFMLLGGTHFGLLFNTAIAKRPNIITSKVFRTYVLVMLIGILLIAIKLTNDSYYDWWESLRHASFQVISLATTTGFATVDTPNWPFFTIVILIYFTIQCGMVGSTAGGLKFDRVYLFFKSLKKQIKSIQHPNAIYSFKMDDVAITPELELHTIIFIVLYIITLSVTAALLSAMNVDGITSFSASIATIGNAGPGFGKVSSLGNYSCMSDAGKYLLSANMLVGRLEILNIIALFSILNSRNR